MSELRKILDASDRAARIREFREETIPRPFLPKVLARKTMVQNGRVVDMVLVDATRIYGRGSSFWMNAGLH